MNQKTEAQSDRLTTLRRDFLASIVVFLVALPLCMGIAIASGVPVAAGLITGIVGGLVVAWFAGCPLQVSGPAAGLTVIVYEIVQEFGFEMLGIVVLLAGGLQLLAGVLKLGQWFRAVSPAVIKGMLGGIGVLIFASQFHVMVDDKPKGSGLENLITIPAAVAKGLSLPDFGSTEERKYRTDALRKVGEIHRKQAAIAERIAESLPDHSPESEEGADESLQAKIASEVASLDKLIEEQKELAEELEALSETIRNNETSEESGDQAEEILATLPVAKDKVAKAISDLENGTVRDVSKSQAEAVSSLEGVLGGLKNHPLAAQIGLLTIIVIIVWQSYSPKKLKLVPAPLIAIVAAALIAGLFAFPVLYVEVPSNLFSELHFPTFSMLSDAPWAGILRSAVVVAVVASAETLLCATAVDQMHQGPRTKYDKELAAQGIGNIVCGCVGALPMTGVIVRSTANIQAGGRTRASAILHGVWLLVFVAGLAFLLRTIPTSGLAAILVYTGYKLVNPKSVLDLKKYGWGEVFIYLATIGTIVCTDLLTGVIVGVILAAAKLLYTFSHLRTNLVINEKSNQATLNLEGSATFLRLPQLAAELENVPSSAELHVDLEHLDYIDHACLDLLMNWARQHESTGGRLVIDWESLHARFRAEDANGNGNGNGNGKNASSSEGSADGGEVQVSGSSGHGESGASRESASADTST